MKENHMRRILELNNYNALINNLETLELIRIRENIDNYITLISEGTKTVTDALYELTEQELGNIIGESVEDDLVNEIFSKFCMGK